MLIIGILTLSKLEHIDVTLLHEQTDETVQLPVGRTSTFYCKLTTATFISNSSHTLMPIRGHQSLPGIGRCLNLNVFFVERKK